MIIKSLEEHTVNTAKEARDIAYNWIKQYLWEVADSIRTGLPEVDDRYDAWRVAIVLGNSEVYSIGEIRIDFKGNVILHTNPNLIIKRVEKFIKQGALPEYDKKPRLFYPTPITNKIVLGDTAQVLEEFPRDTAQLVMTSPPYFNAKPETCEFLDYQEYLNFLRKVIIRCKEILSDGRFFIVNISPVLVRRTSRSTSSKRIPIPFDIHRIMDSVGFEFIDDIIWVKPEGAGWNLGRGRRFAADRQPLQYKPVSVTEYVLVYRKKTNKLIDWNIRNHYNKKLVEQSKILGDYDVTNVWYIPPGHNKEHPAVFPDELVRKIIRYYSFLDDLVLDPFGGSGTVGKIALEMKRRFLLIDNNPSYYELMKREISKISQGIQVDFEISEKYKSSNEH